MEQKRYLVLQNGRVFEGKAFGAPGETVAEIVFTTGMTGYIETLTDRSYYGQAVVQTFPLVGNYGVITPDQESDCARVKAYIVREWCEEPSNFRSEGDIDAFLKKMGIPGLYGIDTRALTKVLRDSGVMNGMICDDPSHADPAAIAAYRVKDAVPSVSTKEPLYTPAEDAKYTVALLDYGIKENIRRKLLARGCNVWLMPYDSTPEQIRAVHPDGVMLSNGPGDPIDNPASIETLRSLLRDGDLPIFGICLGHQLLALAAGFTTSKLKYGHRGVNQPARDLTTDRIYTTSQNHGYAVDVDSVDPKVAKLLFVNQNDGTCEGLQYLDAPAFSVQFHPEGCGGPQDTTFLFSKFLDMMAK